MENLTPALKESVLNEIEANEAALRDVEGVKGERRAAARETRKQTKAEQAGESKLIRRRANIIREIGDKLVAQSEKVEPDLERTTLTVDDIGWGRAKNEFLEIDPEEPVGTLGRLLTDHGRRKNTDPETITRRVAVVDDNLTGETYVLSTYKPGDGSPMIVDPRKSGQRPNVSVASFFRDKMPSGKQRYTPIASILLDEPVRNFQQRFETRQNWEDQFGSEARAEAQVRGAASEQLRMASEEGVEPEAPSEAFAKKFERPVTDREASALYDHFAAEEVGSVQDVNNAFSDLFVENQALQKMSPVLRNKKENKARVQRMDLVLGTLAKMGRKIEQAESLEGEAALGRTLDWIYENIGPEGKAQRRSEFVRATLGQFAPQVEGFTGRTAAGLVANLKASAPSPTAKELTALERIPPTMERGEVLPKGAGAPGLEETAAMPGEITPPELTPSSIEQRLAREAGERQRAWDLRHKTGQERKSYTEWLREHEGMQPEPRPGEPSSLQQTPGAYLKPAAQSTARAVRDTVLGFGRWYSEWMVDRLRRVGGPIVRQSMDVFNEIISRERELYGELTPILNEARKAAGSMTGGTRWLHTVAPVTPRAGIANTVGAIEGTLVIPSYAQRTVDMARSVNLQIGQMLQPVIQGFNPSGKFQRNLTAFGYDLIRTGRGRAWEDWTQGLAAANGIPVAAVRGFF
jgi:hypothetical protein